MNRNKIVKLQRRHSDFVVSIPAMAHEELKEVEYMKCIIDEEGIHYKKLKFD